MSSRLDPETYSNYPESDWFEFMYSNSKYIKLKPNTKYVVKFKFKIIERIYLNTDSSSYGYAYILARSKSGADADSEPHYFAKNNSPLDSVMEYGYIFTTGNADDYYILLGLFGRGVLIIDDISISEI